MDSLSISTTLYLEHLSISNFFPGSLNIFTKYTLISTLYLERRYLELLSILDKYCGPVVTNLSLSQTFYLHVL